MGRLHQNLAEARLTDNQADTPGRLLNADSPGRLSNVWIGCAGWSIPRLHADAFPAQGTHLERYATRFDCVEINSSFYSPHRAETYARWAGIVPAEFRCAVKVPREITHTRKLVDVEAQVERFLSEATALGPKIGPLLVQLPPRLAFEREVAQRFFGDLRERFQGDIVCEPRHAAWFETGPDNLLAAFKVGRVAADPAVVPAAAQPGGWPGIAYYRLHGSPRIYYSAYSADTLRNMAAAIRKFPSTTSTWCIFDNTAAGAAITNALELAADLQTDR